MKKKKKDPRGGKREGAGRPPLAGEPTGTLAFRLPERIIVRLRELYGKDLNKQGNHIFEQYLKAKNGL